MNDLFRLFSPRLLANLGFAARWALFGVLLAVLGHYGYTLWRLAALSAPDADATRAHATAQSDAVDNGLAGGQVEERHVAVTPRQSGGAHSYRDAVTRAGPAVVSILVTDKQVIEVSPGGASDGGSGAPSLFDELLAGAADPAPAIEVNSQYGSGVIVSAEGYILTNRHLIFQADDIQVSLYNGQRYRAKLVGSDAESDLAVLQIAPTTALAVAEASRRRLLVGDVVLAIGNAFGGGQTVTQGIVSARNRRRFGLNNFEEFIQTDAAINPGNSGGALVNAYGELVGINTATFVNNSGSYGIGFAIPIELAQGILKQIVDHGRAERGWLGVQTYDISREMRQRFEYTGPGVLVTGVFGRSPADLAGIRAGDVLTHIQGRALLDMQILHTIIQSYRPATLVEVDGWRDGVLVSWAVELSARP